MVTGLVCVEMLKLVQLPDKKIGDFKNAFANLALPFVSFSEPIEAPVKQARSAGALMALGGHGGRNERICGCAGGSGVGPGWRAESGGGQGGGRRANVRAAAGTQGGGVFTGWRRGGVAAWRGAGCGKGVAGGGGGFTRLCGQAAWRRGWRPGGRGGRCGRGARSYLRSVRFYRPLRR